ncbi:hypothetical protein SaccyDRAFT_1478 [Saccharomonospora cyanea NA-134]|uniref:Uncharacterized protein n=1 Tax=Saccharomonospora cyanea NA-134 TaxID=882082 RepID=H5XEY7_9PSEU|nr:hypothetical protein SaccyDRAFT_1478 [Saccharomonospora cyanea NA-134]
MTLALVNDRDRPRSEIVDDVAAALAPVAIDGAMLLAGVVLAQRK